LQHGSSIGHKATGENLIDPIAHVCRTDIGQEPQSAAIHSDHGHGSRSGQSRGAKHCAVAAYRDDQICACCDLCLRQPRYRDVEGEFRFCVG
jgi:hypothetical protein